MKESEVAACFRAPLLAEGIGFDDVGRAGGFMFCMSGPNAAHAYAAYARSRARKLERGDLVLIHCNSFADGYWTDITRTYTLGGADDRQQRLYEAVFRARREALNRVRPGVRAADVDRAAREVVTAAGLGNEFKHSTGHGVGYAAIDHTAPPACTRTPPTCWGPAWSSTWSRRFTSRATAACGTATWLPSR
jgi:Xaa-Pro aminopeptidase